MEKKSTVMTDMQNFIDMGQSNPNGIINTRLKVPIQNLLNAWKQMPPEILSDQGLNVPFMKFINELEQDARIIDQQNVKKQQESPTPTVPVPGKTTAKTWLNKNCVFGEKSKE